MDKTAIGGVTRRAHSHPPQPMDEASLTMDDPAIYPTPLPNGMAITKIDMTNERSSLSNKSVITKYRFEKIRGQFAEILDSPKCWIFRKNRFLPVGAMHEYDASPIPTIARVARKKLKFSAPLMKDDPITTAVQNIKPHKIIAFLLYRSPKNIN